MTSKPILIADDDPVVRMILSSILTANGYEVSQAEDGASCLATADALLSAGAPFAIFLDFQLPDMTGVEVITALRKKFGTEHVPIIMLSANPQEEVSSMFQSSPPDLYLQKPFVSQTILEALDSVGRK